MKNMQLLILVLKYKHTKNIHATWTNVPWFAFVLGQLEISKVDTGSCLLHQASLCCSIVGLNSPCPGRQSTAFHYPDDDDDSDGSYENSEQSDEELDVDGDSEDDSSSTYSSGSSDDGDQGRDPSAL
jgi:hypothetical protein